MPISRQVRITRSAISPRFAIRIRRNMGAGRYGARATHAKDGRDRRRRKDGYEPRERAKALRGTRAIRNRVNYAALGRPLDMLSALAPDARVSRSPRSSP